VNTPILIEGSCRKLTTQRMEYLPDEPEWICELFGNNWSDYLDYQIKIAQLHIRLMHVQKRMAGRIGRWRILA
jgi:hypothetical protein